MDTAGFIAGLLLGAVPAALAFVVVGSVARTVLPAPACQALTGLAAVVLLARELGLLAFPVPQNARLVPQLVAFTPVWGAVRFGAEMGTGMRTYSPTGLPHLVAVALFLLASWPEALWAGAGFALGRTLPPLVLLPARDRRRADRALDSAVPALAWLFALLMAPLAAILVAT
ncbi:hypothetical protein [Thermostaphylospora chromogena]|uniref:Uncharacterized protein n=1 Tax=Thermostaphylospora chromogena TaxID=35622 RepID=A0A1H1FUT9_9ACTN|nr:hypothetical protein [Thermostaphylospora chromogena]SDR04724.1 hypothetical protein SAMN04489764_3197 [Thermostaphylospora chromogena]